MPTARTRTRCQQYASADTASIPEASFQYDVEAAATANGWRLDLRQTLPLEHLASNNIRHTRTLKRLRHFLAVAFGRAGLPKAHDLLLKRRRGIFTLAYHTHDSRNSQAGFPDLVLVHPIEARIIFAELKRDKDYPKPEQRLWAAALKCVEHEYPDAIAYRLWKPKDWHSIVEELGGTDPYNPAH